MPRYAAERLAYPGTKKFRSPQLYSAKMNSVLGRCVLKGASVVQPNLNLV